MKDKDLMKRTNKYYKEDGYKLLQDITLERKKRKPNSPLISKLSMRVGIYIILMILIVVIFQ